MNFEFKFGYLEKTPHFHVNSIEVIFDDNKQVFK